jgi:hypothetical protein
MYHKRIFCAGSSTHNLSNGNQSNQRQQNLVVEKIGVKTGKNRPTSRICPTSRTSRGIDIKKIIYHHLLNYINYTYKTQNREATTIIHTNKKHKYLIKKSLSQRNLIQSLETSRWHGFHEADVRIVLQRRIRRSTTIAKVILYTIMKEIVVVYSNNRFVSFTLQRATAWNRQSYLK